MATVYVKVNNSAIQSLFEPGGPVGREARAIMREAIGIARARGPKRTGKLVGGLSQSGAMGRYSWKASLFARAPYAGYVIHGTDRIYPKGGGWLKVPRSPAMALAPRGRRDRGADTGRFTFKRSVRGQAANPFMQNAVQSALRSHGIAVSFL